MDSTSRDALFHNNLAWAETIARNVSRRLPPSFDPADLEQEARIELWKQAQKFDPDRGVPFQGFAYMAVRGAVLMSCRRRHWAEAVKEELGQAQVDERPLADQELAGRQQLEARDKQLEERGEWMQASTDILPAGVAYVMKRYIEGETVADLAKLWGVPPAVIKRRISAGIKMLRKEAKARV